MAEGKTTYVYISNGGDKGAGGIYLYALNSASLDFQSATATPLSTKYLAVDPQGRYLYATSTHNTGDTNGLIHAFEIDADTGRLTLLNQADVQGSEPAHCSLDRAGKFAFVASYMGRGDVGTICVFRLEENGHIGVMSDFHEISGSSVHPERQQRSHPHQILIDPTNRYVLVPDLGTDKIMMYQFDPSTGKLTPHEQPFIAVPPGSGPRHVAFHETLPYVYLINELSNTLIVYRGEDGRYRQIQEVSTLPADFKGESYCAAVRVSPDGRTVYGSNRGHNSIVVFSISQNTGEVTPTSYASTHGNWPRDFHIAPGGSTLIVANQISEDLCLYNIDPTNGSLQPTGSKTPMPEPICIAFV